jgi:Tol biopolymer transport system component
MKKIAAAGGQPEDLPQYGKAFSGPVATENNLPSDGRLNFSPQFAPNGQNIVFLSTTGDRASIAEDKDISLRVLSTTDRKVRVFANIVGGKGTAPSWSPDSRRIAFISYQWIQ